MNTVTEQTLQKIYGWDSAAFFPVASGLINHTQKVSADGGMYICQEINTQVFRNPHAIDANLGMLAEYLAKHFPEYLFTAPVKTAAGDSMVCLEGHYYRVFDWVKDSHTIDVVESPAQAFEAANQFGMFTSNLKHFDAGKLQVTLPDFHNLGLRYQQFEQALLDGDPSRIKETPEEINILKAFSGIVSRFEKFTKNAEARLRVTHHDTKISNILFNNEQKGICVIDLDTVMPGFFLSDLGDMIRTYVCPVSEEEKDLSKIVVRKDFLSAIEKGYLSTMGETLSSFEKDHFYFSGEVLLYMQALRFLTDYLNRDVYYGSRYPGHNLVRAKNQIRLLEVFQETIR